MQSVHCRLVALLKQTIVSKLSQSIISCNILICVEESNFVKDHMKDRGQARGKKRLVSEALWKYNEYWIFVHEHFSFYEKVNSPPDPIGSFSFQRGI